MTDVVQTRSFRTGAEAAKVVQTGSSFMRLPYFSLKDGERKFVQFITDCDEWHTVDTHAMVPTKAQPAGWTSKWPATVQPVCRLTKMEDGLPLFPDCYVCSDIPDPRDSSKPFKRATRTWSLGVIVEEVFGDGSDKLGGPSRLGKRFGFRMKTVESTTPEGEKVNVPDIQVFTFAWGNFYAAIDGAASINDGTITNLIFAIQRSGTGTDTKYVPSSVGVQTRNFNEEKYLKMCGIELKDGKKIYPPHMDIPKMIMDRASDDYFARFIDPTKTVEVKPEKKSNDVEPADLEAMRARILGFSELQDDIVAAPPEVIDLDEL